MSWSKVKIGGFLYPRNERFKPDDKTIQSLKRIDKIDFSGKIYLSNKRSRTDLIKIMPGDLVISGINVEKGAIAVYHGEEPAVATIHYSSYQFDEAKVDIAFLKVFFRSPAFLNALKEQVPGGIKTEIKPKHLLPLEIVIPTSVSEQQELVNLLDKRSKKINLFNLELTHQLNILKKLRQQILQDAIQGKLVPQNADDEPASVLLEKIKVEKNQLIKEKKINQSKLQVPESKQILFEIPKEWLWCYLDDVCINITDGTHQTPIYTSSGKVFLSAQNIKPFKFMPANHKFVSIEDYNIYIKNKVAEKGDILIARVGAGIGEAAVIDKDIEFAFYVSLGLIKPFKEFVNSTYLGFVINSSFGVKYAKGNISSKGGSAGNFNLGRIRSFQIPLPPLNEQLRIIDKVENLIRKCDEFEQFIFQSKEHVNNLSLSSFNTIIVNDPILI